MQYLLPYILYSPSTNLNSNNLYNFIVLKLTTMNFNISNKIESLNYSVLKADHTAHDNDTITNKTKNIVRLLNSCYRSHFMLRYVAV